MRLQQSGQGTPCHHVVSHMCQVLDSVVDPSSPGSPAPCSQRWTRNGKHRRVAVGEPSRRLSQPKPCWPQRPRTSHLVCIPRSCGWRNIHSICRWLRCHSSDEDRCFLTFDHGPREHFQPDRQVLVRSRTKHRKMQRLVQQKRQLRLVRSKENFQQSRVQQGDSLGPSLFTLGLHRAISERLAHAESVGSPVDMAAFCHDDGRVHLRHPQGYEGLPRRLPVGPGQQASS